MSRRLATLLTVLAPLAVAGGAWLTFVHGDEVRGHAPGLSACPDAAIGDRTSGLWSLRRMPSLNGYCHLFRSNEGRLSD